MDFRSHIRNLAKNKNPILEIGPSYNPILPKSDGYSVKTVDHADQATLIGKYTAFGVDTSKIEPVDFITTDIGSINSSSEKFEVILASHVIEHSTDIVKFLSDCSNLLSDTGVLVLLVPDKRFCFDTHRPLTSAGAAIDAHIHSRAFHHGSVFDHYTYFTTKNGAMAWGADDHQKGGLIHSDEQCVDALQKATSDSEYVDAHEWVFTPSSFRLLIQDLKIAGFIDLSLASAYDSVGYEFYVTLSKSPVEQSESRDKLLKLIDHEEAVSMLTRFSSEEIRALISHTHPEVALASGAVEEDVVIGFEPDRKTYVDSLRSIKRFMTSKR